MEQSTTTTPETTAAPLNHLDRLRSHLRGNGLNFGDITGSISDRERYQDTFLDYLTAVNGELGRDTSQSELTPFRRDKVSAKITFLHRLALTKPGAVKVFRATLSNIAESNADIFPEIQTAVELHSALHNTEASEIATDIVAGYGYVLVQRYKQLGAHAVKVADGVPKQITDGLDDLLAQQVG